MTATSLSNPTAASTSAERTNTPSPTPRRRGLSSLRRLGPPSPGESSRLSPRNYFSRSVSYPQNPPNTPRATPAKSTLRSNAPQPPGATDPASRELVSREITDHPTSNTANSTTSPLASPPGAEPPDMARHRPPTNPRATTSESVHSVEAQRSTRVGGDTSDGIGNVSNAQTNDATQEASDEKTRQPTIRFFPHQDLRQGRPSLSFNPIIRTLPHESSIIRVGRYSEREGIPISTPTGPSDAPVGFKSKVVSRKHCEFSFSNGSWQIKDVSSSSGTFLNHIRLSQPNTESRLYPVKDGDIVQLGIDFRGGEEMIFRCVKIRIECNRAWQKRPNNFNMSRHAQLQKLGKGDAKVDENKGECSICLGDVAPCQSLFIAACAHVWHYKCIRRMLMGSNYPQFTCPNCRAITDLEAEFDVEDGEEWEQPPESPVHVEDIPASTTQPANSLQNQQDTVHVGGAAAAYDEAGDVDLTNIQFEGNADQTIATPQTTINGLLSRRQTLNSSASPAIAPVDGIEIPRASNAAPLGVVVSNDTPATLRTATPTSVDLIGGEGPLTPRNDAGPFVFDGSAGRASGRRLTASATDEPE
ncbi:hypothetical protein EPUS_00535 [Endocarpon pusillum Z07020]|uniref:FHA domain-containing protein n=1 Tax=Endocarpon pusillum (strain Z07020 / HMAS-L-300199) TaxID=1263415 RepID=U1GIB1_ENDPU|nr:uncharacterized protein EPUS_00535 [Endocarpon pusillum Z07020]ERF71546.1 hypothetical protein EPUS_00535 [Endocarpon pusillum Z07020]